MFQANAKRAENPVRVIKLHLGETTISAQYGHTRACRLWKNYFRPYADRTARRFGGIPARIGAALTSLPSQVRAARLFKRTVLEDREQPLDFWSFYDVFAVLSVFTGIIMGLTS